jgi:hypothetical protein
VETIEKGGFSSLPLHRKEQKTIEGIEMRNMEAEIE